MLAAALDGLNDSEKSAHLFAGIFKSSETQALVDIVNDHRAGIVILQQTPNLDDDTAVAEYAKKCRSMVASAR